MTSTVTGPTTHPPSEDGNDVFAGDHEQVVFCHDAETGLRAIIALHSTALGPGLGGTRFYPYAEHARGARRRPPPVPRHDLQERGRPGWTTAAARP